MSRSRSLSFFRGRAARIVASIATGVAVTGGLAVAGTGVASAARVDCVSPPSANDIRVIGDASCGATATNGGSANAGATDSGTAVSVSEGGAADTFATGYGVALSSSKVAGQAHAYAIGGGIAHARTDNGDVTFALAGWGSGATAASAGVNCVGPLSFAVNLNTGAVCLIR
ncbi:DUF6764 family protein [Rhodococcus sp. NPDC003318]|uniref:DUF6764 family protein n=1 Tax=Rhodococcus sp. NPDC003318 TaxID=3364503 RepID=UPI003675C6D3